MPLLKCRVNEHESTSVYHITCPKTGDTKQIKGEKAYRMYERLHRKKCDCLNHAPTNESAIDTKTHYQTYGKIDASVELVRGNK